VPGEAPRDYVLRVALAKARAVRERAACRPVLAADTAVICDDRILGKPRDAADAARCWRCCPTASIGC
jgi:septum formation protein